VGIKLGEWVVQTALTHLDQWNAAHLHTAVSVNIDAAHLQQDDFVTRLGELLAQHPKVRAQQLDLEVLETSALEDMDKVSVTMTACCALGVGFSLDDFGTGYSSLTYLKRLPADLIKIDQSFVMGMLAESDDFVIVEGVLGLAKAFGRAVLAEGVETIAHGELLLAMGCELGQGYGIARPMPAQAVSAWVQQWQPEQAWSMWNDLADAQNSCDLVHANIKHRHWLRDIQNFVTGASDVAPPLDTPDCPLGIWLGSTGQERYGQHPGFSKLKRAHAQMHAAAKQLIDWHLAGMHDKVSASLSEFNVLQDAVQAKVAELRHGSR